MAVTLGEWNLGRATMVSWRWASGVWEEEKSVGESPPKAAAEAVVWDHM